MAKIWSRIVTAGALATCGIAGIAIAQSTAPAEAQGSAATAASGSPSPSGAVTAEQDQLLKSTEAFVRDLYAWGPEYAVKVGPPAPSPAPDYYRVTIQVTYNGQTDNGDLFVSKDGKTVLRGDIFELNKDPYAGVRAHLNAEGNPSTGPENAPVTLVEFADFECPHCKDFNDAFATLQQKFPHKIRLIYKDYPLSDIHPWAETAAIAARCAFLQSPADFWKMHDAIFKNQDGITPDDAWDTLNGYAKDEGIDPDTFKACMASPEAKKEVDANRDDALKLGVSSTPTVYVNGRPVIGGDPSIVTQYIQYELDRAKK
jgi:protein-disulfide isomerase